MENRNRTIDLISPPLSRDTDATDRGRQGAVSGRIVTILGASLLLAVVALFAAYALT